MIRRLAAGRSLQHGERLADGVQRVRLAAFHAQHAQRVDDSVRVGGERLVDLHLVAERDHRGLARIRRQ